MESSRGEALENAFDACFDAMGKTNYEAIHNPREKCLVVCDGPTEVGRAYSSVQAGILLAKIVKGE